MVVLPWLLLLLAGQASADSAWCAMTSYETDTHICCNNVVQERPEHGEVECCGTAPYIVERQMCCDEVDYYVVNDRPYGGREACCGRYAYDRASYLCCDGNRVRRRYPYHSAQCCGRYRSYFPDRELCCEGFNRYVPDVTHYACCRSGTYDTRFQDCCTDGRVVPEGCCDKTWGSGQMCCGGVVISSSEYMCCGKVAYSIDERGTCCEGVYWPFDYNLGYCCGCTFVKQLAYDRHKGCCGSGHPYISYSPNYCCGREVITNMHRFEYCLDYQAYDNPGYVTYDGDVILYSPSFNVYRCGDSEYDALNEYCCDGVIHEREDYHHCCGKKMYNYRTQFCCNRVIFDHQEGQNWGCCGDQPWYPATQICCWRNVYDNPDGTLRCCNDQAYDTTVNQCCSGKIVPLWSDDHSTRLYCCYQTTYDSRTQRCCYIGWPRIYESYNFNTEMCCGNKVLPLYNSDGARLACCYDAFLSYNPNEQTCCGNSLVDNDSVYKCCFRYPWGEWSGVLYNSEESICCRENMWGDQRVYALESRMEVEQQCCTPSLHNNGEGICCNFDIWWGYGYGVYHQKMTDCKARIGCCRERVYNLDTELCCGGWNIISLYPDERDHLACCGTYGVYHFLDQLCCNGNAYTKTSDNDQCCGHTGYNPDRQICCRYSWRSYVVRDRISEHDRCCYNQNYDPTTDIQCCFRTLYNATEDICCRGRRGPIVRALNSDQTCCGHDDVYTVEEYSTFNDETDLCCEGIHHRNAHSRGEICCGIRTYDPETQLCCNDHPVSKNGGSACCGCTAYDPETELCCPEDHDIDAEQEVFKNPDGNLSCCGTHAYDPDEEICCENRYPLDLDHDLNQKCCGVQLYDPETQDCCEMRVIDQIEGHRCCGRRLYDPETQICCRDDEGYFHFVYDKVPGEMRLCCGRYVYNPDNNECCYYNWGQQYIC